MPGEGWYFVMSPQQAPFAAAPHRRNSHPERRTTKPWARGASSAGGFTPSSPAWSIGGIGAQSAVQSIALTAAEQWPARQVSSPASGRAISPLVGLPRAAAARCFFSLPELLQTFLSLANSGESNLGSPSPSKSTCTKVSLRSRSTLTTVPSPNVG